MRGTANEDAILLAFSRQDYVRHVSKVGMLSMKDSDWIACSPDAIGIIDIDGTKHVCTVEVKTSVGDDSVRRIINTGGGNRGRTLRCRVGDTTCKSYIPPEHIGQVLQQQLVLNVAYSCYVTATETGIAYIVIMYCSPKDLEFFCNVLIPKAQRLLAWARQRRCDNG